MTYSHHDVTYSYDECIHTYPMCVYCGTHTRVCILWLCGSNCAVTRCALQERARAPFAYVTSSYCAYVTSSYEYVTSFKGAVSTLSQGVRGVQFGQFSLVYSSLACHSADSIPEQKNKIVLLCEYIFLLCGMASLCIGTCHHTLLSRCGVHWGMSSCYLVLKN